MPTSTGNNAKQIEGNKMNTVKTLVSMQKVVKMYQNGQINLRKYRNLVMQMELMLEDATVSSEVTRMMGRMKDLAQNVA